MERITTPILKDKYNSGFTGDQLRKEAVYIHKEVHRLLYGKENSDPKLPIYYDKLQRLLAGLNGLLDNPPELITLMGDIEAARIESCKDDFDHDAYRRLILDSHSIVDKLFWGANDDYASE